VDGDAGAAEEIGKKCSGRRLPRRARDSDRRHRRTLEHEIAEATDDAAALAEQGDARRDLGRPDVEERLVVPAGVAVEVRMRSDLDPVVTERESLL
jgi:hypothetical protein